MLFLIFLSFSFDNLKIWFTHRLYNITVFWIWIHFFLWVLYFYMFLVLFITVLFSRLEEPWHFLQFGLMTRNSLTFCLGSLHLWFQSTALLSETFLVGGCLPFPDFSGVEVSAESLLWDLFDLPSVWFVSLLWLLWESSLCLILVALIMSWVVSFGLNLIRDWPSSI